MIRGKNLRLRAIEKSDLPHFVRWLNDPEVIAGLTIDWPLSLWQEEEWFAGLARRPIHERPLMIEVAQNDGWQPIGNLSLHGIDWKIRQAEVGILIGEKSFWNRGYGGEALRLLIDHAFAELNLNRIFLRVYANNPRAIRAYEKIGFVHEGRLRQAHYADHRYHDVLIMSVLRSEWKQV